MDIPENIHLNETKLSNKPTYKVITTNLPSYTKYHNYMCGETVLFDRFFGDDIFTEFQMFDGLDLKSLDEALYEISQTMNKIGKFIEYKKKSYITTVIETMNDNDLYSKDYKDNNFINSSVTPFYKVDSCNLNTTDLDKSKITLLLTFIEDKDENLFFQPKIVLTWEEFQHRFEEA